MTPPGTVIMVAMNTAPAGFLKANGALINRLTYAGLFAAIGTTFGAGDGVLTFAIPDLRGEFPRYWDDARGIDAGRVFGSAQTDGVKSHTHDITIAATSPVSAAHTHTVAVSGSSGGRSASHNHTASGTTAIASATHTHAFADSSSASGTGSANHAHTFPIHSGSGADTNLTGRSGDAVVQANMTTSSTGAAHTHTVAVSGTTGGQSANHTHTFSDVTTNETTEHVHTFSDASSTTGAQSSDHTHSASGVTAANASAIAENRVRNIALLACIKY